MKTEWEKLEALMAAPPEDDAGAIIVDYYAIRNAWPRIQAAIQAARDVLSAPHDVTTESTNLYAALQALGGGRDDE